jgi:hypothetical protein
MAQPAAWTPLAIRLKNYAEVEPIFGKQFFFKGPARAIGKAPSA